MPIASVGPAVSSDPDSVRPLRPARLMGALWITTVALAALGVGLPLVSSALPGSFGAQAVANVFWVDNDLNVWAWFSTLLLALLALGFAASALVQRTAGRPVVTDVVFAAVAAYLSLDENARLHERLGSLGERVAGTWTYAWVAIGLPAALVVGLLLLWIARRTDSVTRRRLIVAGTVYLAGALGLEVLGGVLHETVGLAWSHPAYILTAGVEELLEAAGVLIALRAAIDRMALRADHGAIVVGPHPA
jgi:hypothetical protein